MTPTRALSALRRRRAVDGQHRPDWASNSPTVAAALDRAPRTGPGGERLAAGDGRPARLGPGRSAILPRRRALLGLVRNARRSLARGQAGARLLADGGRQLLGRQSRAPALDEDTLRPVVAPVPSLRLRRTQTGPAPDCGAQASDPAPVSARVDRLSLSHHPAGRPRCGAGLRVCPSLGRPMGRGGGSRAFARAATHLLSRPDLVLRCAYRGHGRAGGAGLLEIAALATLGHSVRRLLWPGPGHQTQRLAHPLFPLGPLPVDAAR